MASSGWKSECVHVLSGEVIEVNRDEILRHFVCTPSRVAVVGASPKADRPVFRVMNYLSGAGAVFEKGDDICKVHPMGVVDNRCTGHSDEYGIYQGTGVDQDLGILEEGKAPDCYQVRVPGSCPDEIYFLQSAHLRAKRTLM